MPKTYFNLPNKKIYLYRFLILISVVFLGLFIFILISTETIETTLNIMLVALIWTLLFYLIPLIYIYFNYSNENRNSLFMIKENSFSFGEINNLTDFNFSDIEKIVLNLSYPLFEKRIRLFFWDEYYYAEIFLKNKEPIIITCLLYDDLENKIPEKLIIRKKRIFPIIRKNVV